MLRTLAIAFLVVFLLFLLGQDDLVNKGIEFTKQQARYTQEHGVEGLFNRLWCGEARCKEHK